ncbi:MAG: VCBS repeat-containing protein [Runella sp.]
MQRNILYILWLCLGILSCQNETHLFHLRPTKDTGVDFVNTLTDSDTFNAMTFEYIYNGAGVAAADFNNDGLTDLFFSGNQVSNRLYLNQGRLKFKDVTSASGLVSDKWCTGVAVADINQDGWQDIYVCVAGFVEDTTQRANLLYINQGLDKNGIPTFVEKAAQYGLNDMGYSTQAAFFDYDRDGDLDCYVLTNALEKENRNALRPKRTYGEAPSNDRLYRNDNGQFFNVTHQAGILTEGYGLGICVSDLNGDGWEDVYCANDFLSNDLVWLNNQNGTFTNRAAELMTHQTHNGMGVDIADFNNDTRPDIIVLDMLPETNERQKMMLAGSNHDRFHLDLKLGYQPQFMKNTLQLNLPFLQKNNSTRFSEIAYLAGVAKTDWSWSSLFADLDCDGLQDVLITNGYRRDVTNMDFTAYLASQRELMMFNQTAKDKAKVYQKLKELPQIKIPNYAYRNRGDLTFEDVSEKWGLSLPSYSNGAVYADLDNDGDLDYVVNNIDDEAFVFENTANTQPNFNFLKVKLQFSELNRDGLGSKLKLYSGGQVFYRENQPVRGYVSCVEPVVHFGLGMHQTIDSLLIFWPDGTYQKEFPYTSNQSLTIKYTPQKVRPYRSVFDEVETSPIFSEINPATVGLYFNHTENEYNDFNQNPLLPYKLSRISPCIAVGDVNADGLDDLFVGTDTGSPAKIFLQQAEGKFISKNLPESEAFEDVAATFFDADTDGDLDLYVVSGGSHVEGESEIYQDRLYLNDGKGAFTWQKNALPKTSFSGGCVSVADIDQDGDLDVFRGSRLWAGQYPLPPQSYFFINHSDKSKTHFIDKTSELASDLEKVGMITAATWADFDNDKTPDLLVVGEWLSPMLFKNQKGKLIHSPTPDLSSLQGLWQSVLADDLDHDGDIDIAIGNIGLNTKYTASAEKPLRIYAKDFDKNDRLDPIMSFYLKDKEEIPVPTRDLITLKIPGLKKYFPTYTEYAQAKMWEILDKKDLNDSYKLTVNELRSGWLENNGKGSFQFHPFPTEAQFSVINAILKLNDCLILTGNSHAPETIGGWWNASKGTVLRLNQNKKFDTVKSSGFWADKEPRALGKLKRKDDQLLIVGNVNEVVQVFKTLN